MLEVDVAVVSIFFALFSISLVLWIFSKGEQLGYEVDGVWPWCWQVSQLEYEIDEV